MADLISKKTRTEFREYFVGTSLSVIEREFESADVLFDAEHCPPVSGQRRTLVEQYYHSVEWNKWSDVRKILTVFENVLIHLEDESVQANATAEKEFAKLRKWIERDGYRYEKGRLSPIGGHQGLQHIADTITALDLPELKRQLDRIYQSIESDPGLAIGTAKELVESVCKTILTDRNVSYLDDADIGQLVKEVRKAIGLLPDSIPDSAKGVESIRRVLGNLGAVAQGLGELRNLYGTGHGKDGSSKRAEPETRTVGRWHGERSLHISFRNSPGAWPMMPNQPVERTPPRCALRRRSPAR